jgi:uncharacterized protein (DUF885 family)
MAACPASGVIVLTLLSCAPQGDAPLWSAVRERYVLGFLERNPVTCTYLGGEGYSPGLLPAGERLPDVTAAGRGEAARFYRSILHDLDRVDPGRLAPDDRIDRDLARSQILFLLHLEEDLKYYQRSLDTYTVAPFRGIDWQIQQMADLGGGHRGTPEEWRAVTGRVEGVPAFLGAAQANLLEGIASGNIPDPRMVQLDGIETCDSNAAYFRDTLPDIASRSLGGLEGHERVVAGLRAAGDKAASAFASFRAFLQEAYRSAGGADRFVAGEKEYDWRLRNNLRLDATMTAAALFELGQKEVERTQDLLIETARGIAGRRSLRLDWSGRQASLRSARRVMDELSRDFPKNDDEMFSLYREKARDLVDYARRHQMFSLPDDYRLEIARTPPMLESTLDAAYYPAPPFKTSGIGRFYLTPSHQDIGVLKENNVHAIADLCAHEGFPGHDWHYQFMRSRSRAIGIVRWLTPGEVEGSSSMWADSMASEGWALYAEELMASPQPGAADGFYTAEERLYQLKAQLLRAARVRIDTGLHTGRMSFEQAVGYFTANVDLLPEACGASRSDPVGTAVCRAARRAIYRYSKWPTQAITYDLGKREIVDLRERVRQIRGERFSPRDFHERFMSVGTIPAGYVRDLILSEASER